MTSPSMGILADSCEKALGHTPGPWSCRSQPHDDWGVVRADRFWICQAKDPNVFTDDQLAAHRAAGTDPWEANARLIAAAPDLYEACAAVVQASQSGADTIGFLIELHRVAALCTAALARTQEGKP